VDINTKPLEVTSLCLTYLQLRSDGGGGGVWAEEDVVHVDKTRYVIITSCTDARTRGKNTPIYLLRPRIVVSTRGSNTGVWLLLTWQNVPNFVQLLFMLTVCSVINVQF
jgi:hypothetical protein